MEQRDFLRKQMLKKTKEQINEKMAGKEIHIIKAINLLSDLDSINNLMSENASEWKARQPVGEAQEAFLVLEKNNQSIAEEKEKLLVFIEKEMSAEFPNFSVLATPILGAKLLASAGSKKRLCMMPASTVQVLGAEKALFAHLKKNAKSPKHGHLFNHPLLQNLPRFKRGTAARIIAGKLAIALKQDYFNGENTSKEALAEIIKKIDELASEPITPKQEEHEKQYEQINADRRKEEYQKANRKREFRHEEARSRPQEGSGFNTQERRPFQNRGSSFGHRAGSWQDRGPRRERTFGDYAPQRRPFTPRRDGQFSPDYRPKESESYKERGEHPFRPNRNERSFGGERKEGFHIRREGAPRSTGGFDRGPRRFDRGLAAGSFGERREGFRPRSSGFSGEKREGSFGETNRYAKAKFHGKKFGKTKFVKRY